MQAVMHYGESIKAIGNEVMSSQLLHTLRSCSYLLLSFPAFPVNLQLLLVEIPLAMCCCHIEDLQGLLRALCGGLNLHACKQSNLQHFWPIRKWSMLCRNLEMAS